MIENWKEIAGYEGLYLVSDQGRVKSMWHDKERILKPQDTSRGYFQVALCKDDKVNRLLVHRLVAEAFIKNPNNLDTVNHKDDMKTNNIVSNLEWMSREDNVAYSRPQFSKRGVQMFDKKTGELLTTFPSISEAWRVTRIAQPSISACCKGKLKSAGGYVWKYLTTTC